MKTRRIHSNRIVAAVAWAVFVLVATVSQPLLAQTSPPARVVMGSPVVGTWEVTLHGPDGATANLAFVTINADNTLTETSLLDLRPPVSSPGHGVWTHLQDSRFALTFKFFIVDPSGNLVCTAKVRQSATLNETGDQWTGPARLDCLLPDATVLFGADFTATANRMKPEVLD